MDLAELLDEKIVLIHEDEGDDHFESWTCGCGSDSGGTFEHLIIVHYDNNRHDLKYYVFDRKGTSSNFGSFAAAREFASLSAHECCRRER